MVAIFLKSLRSISTEPQVEIFWPKCQFFEFDAAQRGAAAPRGAAMNSIL